MSLLHQLIFVSLAAFAAAQCPGDFFVSNGNCFSVIDMPGVNMTWDECRLACKAKDGGELNSDLATFDTAEELEAFSITWLDESQNYNPDPNMWIGVEKIDGNWETIEGNPVSFQNPMWQEGHPHEMGERVFLQDITLANGINSFGRLCFHCSMGIYEHHSRCLCRAK
uniref:C-type lectin receptor protein n=1 Tax=Eriocheir sinensis TaxID=95602 RepID=F6JS42_ERISI|nr:C-type lectin receptor protein [Eriocheir sinensis]